MSPISKSPHHISESWVWRSSDESIARKQKSIAAVLEIPVSAVLFWVLASVTVWPWLTLLALLCVPLLLMRSPASSAACEKIFRARVASKTSALVSPPVAGLFVLSCLHWLTRWLGVPTDAFKAFGVGFAAGSIVLIAFFACVLWIGNHSIAIRSAAVAYAIIFVGPAASFGSVGSWIAAFGAMCPITLLMLSGFIPRNVVARKGPRRRLTIRSYVGSMFISTSAWVTFLLVRLEAVLTNIRAGLLCFPQNTFETIALVDIFYRSAPLPGVDTSDFIGPWKAKRPFRRSVSARDNAIARNQEHLLLILIAWFASSIYRLNIKANVWLWGGIALAMSQTIWTGERMRRKTAFWTTWVLIGIVTTGLVGSAIWLLRPLLPTDVVNLAPPWVEVVDHYLLAPNVGVRYFLSCMLWASVLALLFSSYSIRAAHAKALEGAGDFKAYGDELQGEFQVMADRVRRWLKICTAIAIVTAWTYCFRFALSEWPDRFSYAAWEFVRPWL